MKEHGHYCKICGEYKANEKFSGKGHAAHICKKCQSMSAEQRSEAQAITKMMNLPYHLSKEQIEWLKNKCHDKRPEVSETAKELFEMRFPYAERNKRKKQICINQIELYVCGEMYDEFGDEYDICTTFTVSRKDRTIVKTNDEGSEKIVLNQNEMTKLLKRMVNSYEVFCWDEDYCVDSFHFDDEELPLVWKVHVEYGSGETQNMKSSLELPDKVAELAEDLLEYFIDDENEDSE